MTKPDPECWSSNTAECTEPAKNPGLSSIPEAQCIIQQRCCSGKPCLIYMNGDWWNGMPGWQEIHRCSTRYIHLYLRPASRLHNIGNGILLPVSKVCSCDQFCPKFWAATVGGTVTAGSDRSVQFWSSVNLPVPINQRLVEDVRTLWQTHEFSM